VQKCDVTFPHEQLTMSQTETCPSMLLAISLLMCQNKVKGKFHLCLT